MSGESSLRNGRRLPSFKAQRDLTLGGSGSSASKTNSASAKKFVPNLNVRRKVVPKDDSESFSESPPSSKSKSFPAPRKKVSEKPLLVQTSSVFSEGVFASGKAAPSRGGGTSGSHTGDGSKSMSGSFKEVDPAYAELEKERLKNLLRDDFIEDFKSGGTPPIQLPMINTGSMFKDTEVKVKIEGETTKKRKNPMRILDDDEEAEGKPLKFNSIRDFVDAPDQKQLFLVQLPDILPGEKNMGSLGEGKLGSIQVRASGQTRLVLENGDELDLELGTQVGFLQNAVSVRHEDPGEEAPDAPPRAGDMTILGQVLHRLVITPSWEALLKKSGNEDDS